MRYGDGTLELPKSQALFIQQRFLVILNDHYIKIRPKPFEPYRSITSQLVEQFSEILLATPDHVKIKFNIEYKTKFNIYDLIELAAFEKLNEIPNIVHRSQNINFLYGKFFRAMQLYYDEATTDVLSFLRHDLDLHVSNFESKLSGKFQLHLFLSAIKSELNKKQAQFGKSIYDLNAQSDFPALCHEAGRQRSHVFPDAEGKTNTLIVLLNITRDTLLAPNYALLSDPFLQQYRFPARYTISLITHFDLLELGLFRQSGLCGKTPLQIYVRNQNLKRLYLASSTTLYFGFHDSLTQLYCVHPDFPFTLSAAKPIGDPAKYFFDKLLKAASPRFEFFANAETKKINSVVISVSGQSNPTVDNLVAKLREFKCDLKQATAAVKVMLQEAYLINQKCEWTSFVNGVTRHASVCRN